MNTVMCCLGTPGVSGSQVDVHLPLSLAPCNFHACAHARMPLRYCSLSPAPLPVGVINTPCT
jgi:hypothetical protein